MGKKKRKPIPNKLRFEVFKRDSFTCQYCGRKAPDILLVIDHIEPVSKGGGNEITNLITSCFECNSGKSNVRLSENESIDKKRAQLEELEERRQQLKLMYEWELELLELENEQAEYFSEYLGELTPYQLSDHGKKCAAPLIKKHGLDKCIDAAKIAFDKYYVQSDDAEQDSNSWNYAYNKIGAILYLQNSSDEKRKLYYIRGILKNRLDYVNDKLYFIIMNEAVSKNINLNAAQKLATEVSSWTIFRDAIREFNDTTEAI